MQDFYPGGIIDFGNNGGSYTDAGEPKGLLHTTEGKNYASARGAYVKNNSWPHATATFEKGFFELYSNNPLTKASRALKNVGGGVETNRDRVAQLEIVGTCDTSKKDWGNQYVENFPQAYLDGIALWMRWVEEQLGVPRVCTVKFLPYPQSSGKSSVRLSNPAFDSYSGWLGHQHAAENVHGDPGLINMAYLLGNTTISPQEEDEMNRLVRIKDQAQVWCICGNGKWAVPSEETRDLLSILGIVSKVETADNVTVLEASARNIKALAGINICQAPSWINPPNDNSVEGSWELTGVLTPKK